MKTTPRNNRQIDSLLTHLDHAGEAVAKCSALIAPLYQYADEMEKEATTKPAKKLLKLIEIEFKKYKDEIQKYWDTPDWAR